MNEKVIPVDSAGRTVIPLQMRKAVGLEGGGIVRVRVAPGGRIEIEPFAPETGRVLKKVGKFLVMHGGRPGNAAKDIRAERDSR